MYFVTLAFQCVASLAKYYCSENMTNCRRLRPRYEPLPTLNQHNLQVFVRYHTRVLFYLSVACLQLSLSARQSEMIWCCVGSVRYKVDNRMIVNWIGSSLSFYCRLYTGLSWSIGLMLKIGSKNEAIIMFFCGQTGKRWPHQHFYWLRTKIDLNLVLVHNWVIPFNISDPLSRTQEFFKVRAQAPWNSLWCSLN